ncbi:hypothetical protein L9F63_008235, partial [Diploptera punctata]
KDHRRANANWWTTCGQPWRLERYCSGFCLSLLQCCAACRFFPGGAWRPHSLKIQFNQA